MFSKLSIALTLASLACMVLCAPKTLGQIERGILRAIDGIYLLQNVVAEMNNNSTHAAAVNANMMAAVYDLKSLRADCNANDWINKDDGIQLLTYVAQYLEPVGSVLDELVNKVDLFNSTTIDGDNARRIVGVSMVQMAQACDLCWEALQRKMVTENQKSQMNFLRDAVEIHFGDAMMAYYRR